MLFLESSLHCISLVSPKKHPSVTTSLAPGDRLIDGVHQRIINLTAVPKSHAEPWAVGRGGMLGCQVMGVRSVQKPLINPCWLMIKF